MLKYETRLFRYVYVYLVKARVLDWYRKLLLTCQNIGKRRTSEEQAGQVVDVDPKELRCMELRGIQL